MLISTVLDRVQQEYGDLLVTDPLILDLGELPLSDFENRFCQRLEPQLLEWLLRNGKPMALSSSAAASTTTTSAKASTHNGQTDALTQFNHYLSQGEWPGTERWAGSNTLDAWLLKQVAAQPQRFLLSLATHCLHPEALQRLYRVLQAATLSRLCRYLAPLQSLNEPVTQWTLRLCALRYFQQHPQCAMPLLWEDELTFIPDGNEPLLVTLFSEHDNAPPTLSACLKALWRQPSVRNILQRRLTSTAFRRLKAWSKSTEASVIERMQDESHAAIERTQSDQHTLINRAQGRPGTAVDQSLEAISINNGGIALLWPLLPGLFEQLGLLKRSRFVHREAQLNAIFWLDELIWADGEYAQSRMPLNKLLCGLPPDAQLDWTPPDSTANDVMQRWLSIQTERLPGWRRLGLADIRQLFLRRPAWLVPFQGNFKLFVQPEVYDVLLNDWPWPKNIAMLPWLAQPLTIEWCKPRVGVIA